jgi:hypothetical protein
MRPTSIMLALALAACSVPASAADVEFEARDDLFERTDPDKSAATELGFGRRVILDGHETYDSPLYEGLWPMTLKAFRGDPRRMRMNADATPLKIPTSPPRLYEPLRIVPPVMPVALNLPIPVLNFAGPLYDHPLYEDLWSMTLAAFRRLDEPKDTEFPTFCIAANS